jgi:hypothetical protein
MDDKQLQHEQNESVVSIRTGVAIIVCQGGIEGCIMLLLLS